MTRFATIILLLLSSVTMLAQTTGTLSGTVQQATTGPAAFAALKLLRATDSSFVNGAVADETGRFAFANVPAGSYRVQASFVGTTTVTSELVVVQAGQPTYLAPILLRADDQTLGTVTIRASRPYVEQQADKTVLNVAANAAAQSKTAYELLQQAPGVVIDPNDNVRMAGKQGVNVYIDGKPTNLSASDLANLLRATPAASIATVELIANPSARFDAQGGAGIVNIKFRRDKKLGLNGNASAGYAQSDHYRANAALDLNYRAKRLNLYGNLSGSDNFQNTRVSINRSSAGQQFRQRGFDTDGTQAIVYKTGVDYFFGGNKIAPQHTLGLLITGNAANNQFGTYTNTDIFGTRNIADSSLTNRVNSPSQNRRFNTALNYQYADTLGLTLYLDADFTRFTNVAPSLIQSDYKNAESQPLFSRQNRFTATTGITIQTYQADLTKEWKALHLKLETGLKHTDVATHNNLLAFTGGAQPGTSEQPDLNRSNQFTYREIVSAAYASLNRTAGKWTMQAGIRTENSTVLGRSTDLLNRHIDRPDTSYSNLFPTAYVQYQASQNSQFTLSYGRRIERPNYQDMNPFMYQIDPYTSQRGNPYLRPAYTQNIALGYTYKWALNLKLAYSSTADYSTNVIRQQGLTGYRTVANVGRADVLNLSLNTPLPITKWWNGYLYAGATWNRFRGSVAPGETFDERAFAFEGYMQHSFTLSKGWGAQVSGFWNAPTQQTIYQIGGLGALNLSIQKKVLQDRGRLTLSLDDLLNTMRWKQAGEFTGGVNFDIYRKWESRRATIRFIYRFGSSDIKEARERKANVGAGRIKTEGNL
jgi:iron complex outermembrane recepter protein